MMVAALFIWCLLISPAVGIKLVVNSSVSIGALTHFWKSTGFCPPLPHEEAYKFDLGEDMVQNLAFIGAIPHHGIEQVRIHWLFDLVSEQIPDPLKSPVYDFTYLDRLIDLLYNNGLRPGFELMGNPSNIFMNMDDKMYVQLWYDLVKQTAQRYIDIYGLGEILNWNFETWNEPNCRDFDKLNMTMQGFLNYYDACSEGLKAASPLLILGGPAEGCQSNTSYADALLDHVVNGINYFTGQKGVRIDYLSYHLKGKGFSKTIIDEEIAVMSGIAEKYPTLARKSFYNDEADPLVGWSKDERWRADATYAAIVAKIIAQHQNAFISNPSPKIKNYTLLSNDNAFLSWYPYQFTQRTLLARFQINTTSPPHTHFFKKPVYSVMGLLSLLGETQIQAILSDKAGRLLDDNLGVLASVHVPELSTTADSWQSTILIYLSNDTGPQNGSVEVEVITDLQPPDWASKDMVMVFWLLDNFGGNLFSRWENMGKPAYPTLAQMELLRAHEGAVMMFNMPVSAGIQYIGKFYLNEPAVVLLHTCSKPVLPPDQVNNVNVYNITTGQVLITWSDKCMNTRCILTYDVVFSKTEDGNYSSILPDNWMKFDTSFVFTPHPNNSISDEFVTGFYKVRAQDYFKHFGEYSLPTQYPSS